jgi:DEAD/DEAH box helicase domain-containing protein
MLSSDRRRMFVVVDIETQELVPDSRDCSSMHVSLAGVDQDGEVTILREHELGRLFGILDAAELIVGHNLLLFDYKVLSRYASFDVVARYKHKTFDMFNILLRKTDRRISLNDLAQRNLGISKAGLGSDAPELWQQGRIDELQEYLTQDLHVTRELVKHVLSEGSLKYGHIVYKEPVEREVKISITDR